MFSKKVSIEKILNINIPEAILFASENNFFALTPKENYWYDISDRTAPKLIDKFILNRNEDYVNILLGIANGKAYFRIGYLGVEVIDLASEKSSRTVGFHKDIAFGTRTKFYEDRYLITNSKKPTVYEIRSSAEFNPVFEFTQSIFDFIILKNYLCAMSLNEGINIYDIINPTNPHLVFSLNLKIVKLVAGNSGIILAQGADSAIYLLDISNLPNISILTKIDIPGPIMSDSLICRNDFLIIRFMRKMVGDTTWAFNISNPRKPKKIFQDKSIGMPLYTASDKLLVFMGIKGWDGVQAISNYTTNLYKILRVRADKVTHIGDIELDGIWFSNIAVLDDTIYIARGDGIYIYEVKNE